MPLFHNTEPFTFCRYLTTSTIRKGAKNPPDVTERPTCLYENSLPIPSNAARRRREPGLCRTTPNMLRSYVTTQPKTLRRSSVSRFKSRVVPSEVVLDLDPRQDASAQQQVGISKGIDRSTRTFGYLHKDWMEQGPNR
jgi:hypothetical protein